MPTRIWVWMGLAVVALVAIVAALTVGEPPQDSEAASAAPGGIVVMDDQPAVDRTPEPTPALLADVVAFVAARMAALPIVEGRATLLSVEADGARIQFNFQVDIVAGDYDLPDDAPPNLSAIVPFACDDEVCFQFGDRFAEGPCRDEGLAPLLQAGGVATFTYRDIDGIELGTMPVTAAMCSP